MWRRRLAGGDQDESSRVKPGSSPGQLRVARDELLRPHAIEVDGEFGVGAGAFHRQDGADAELLVTDARVSWGHIWKINLTIHTIFSCE